MNEDAQRLGVFLVVVSRKPVPERGPRMRTFSSWADGIAISIQGALEVGAGRIIVKTPREMHLAS